MKKISLFLEKAKDFSLSMYIGLCVWALFFMASCSNAELEKERQLRELAQQEASTLKLYLGIAIAAGIIMLILGNIMGSKSLKDSKDK